MRGGLCQLLLELAPGIALKNDEVALFQFLDASMAFDKTLIPIMLKIAFQSGLDDNKWLYWQNMHKNSRKAIKWKGEKSDLFDEQQGVRQGSPRSSFSSLKYFLQYQICPDLHSP